MKSIPILITMFLFVLLGRMCSNKEEVYDDEALSTEQTKGMTIDEATTNWNRFMLTADKMIAISENNLKSLESMINQDTNVNGNVNWKMLYNKSEQELNQLKEELDCRNEDVIDGIKKSDLLQIKENKDFPAKFLHDIVELNNRMEDVIDQ